MRKKIIHSEHGINPTIVVDLKEFIRAITGVDEGGLILGGRWEHINQIFDYFFGEIQKMNAHLVFICQLNEGKYRDINHFWNNNDVFDCIKYHKSLKSHLEFEKTQARHSTLRPIERFNYNLMTLCRKYGQVYANYGLNRRAILTYTRQNQREVLAVMTRNTEFLVFNDDFRFWSLSDIDFCGLKIWQFCRQKLNDALKLNTKQMQLLCVLSQLKMVREMLISEKEGRFDFFTACVSYVKRQQCGPNGYDVSQLTGPFTEAQRKDIESDLEGLSNVDNYEESWTEDYYYNEFLSDLAKNDAEFNLVLQFCKNNIYFVYKLMNEILTVQKDLLFIDLHQEDSGAYIDMIAEVTLKLFGTAFKDINPEKRPNTRTVYLSVNGKAKFVEKEIIYPCGKSI